MPQHSFCFGGLTRSVSGCTPHRLAEAHVSSGLPAYHWSFRSPSHGLLQRQLHFQLRAIRRCRRRNPHSCGTTAVPNPRFRALALFGRRPSECVERPSFRRPKTCTLADTRGPLKTANDVALRIPRRFWMPPQYRQYSVVDGSHATPTAIGYSSFVRSSGTMTAPCRPPQFGSRSMPD
jgi:hypothetical protein